MQINNKHMKRCATSPIMREMETKSILKFSLTPIRIATVKENKQENRKYYRTRACCPSYIEANTTIPTFEKRTSFVARLTGKEARSKAQICLSNPRLGQKIRGWGRS